MAPEATRIRDLYHVTEPIHAIGQLRSGASTPAAPQWINGLLEKLKASELSSVLRSIAHLAVADG